MRTKDLLDERKNVKIAQLAAEFGAKLGINLWEAIKQAAEAIRKNPALLN